MFSTVAMNKDAFRSHNDSNWQVWSAAGTNSIMSSGLAGDPVKQSVAYDVLIMIRNLRFPGTQIAALRCAAPISCCSVGTTPSERVR